jgi:hypothetical protein
MYEISGRLIFVEQSVQTQIKKLYCEIKFSNGKYRHWPVEWCKDMSQFRCSIFNRRTCWSPSIWTQMSQHRCIMQKNFMDPWTAPCQNSNYYWCFTSDQKRWGSNFLQTLVIFTVSTQCYSIRPHKEGELQTNLRSYFLCPEMLHSLSGRQSVSSMMSHHTC